MEKYNLREIFLIHGGNQGLTEEVIYKNYDVKNPESNIPVYSGATKEDFFMPKINKNAIIDNKPIKTFYADNNGCIIVVRKGLAGNMMVIRNSFFTITDDAYVLEPKKAFKNKIDLDWFVYKYQSLFIKISSTLEGNATFNKEIALNLEIDLPDFKEQELIGKKIRVRKKILSHIIDIQNLIDIKIKGLKKIIFSEQNHICKFPLSSLCVIDVGKHHYTEEECYRMLNGKTEYITATTKNEGVWFKIKKDPDFYPPALTFTKNGKVGVVFYRNKPFIANPDVGVIKIRKQTPKGFNYPYLQLVLNHILPSIGTLKQGQGKLNINVVKQLEIPILEEKNMELIGSIYKSLYTINNKLNALKENLLLD